ncbi:MAG: acyl-CoA thioesterase [Myxococcota bacterium]
MAASECTPAASTVEMNQLVLPTHTNALGTVFGGTIMSWIDVCAAMSAQRLCRRVVVTASMDQLDFLAPIRTGQLVNLRARVNYLGRTSMEVGVRVEAEDTLTGDRVHAASAYLTFVALDEQGRPTAIDRALRLTSGDERLRHEEAKERRAQRLQLAERRRELARAHAGPDAAAPRSKPAR